MQSLIQESNQVAFTNENHKLTIYCLDVFEMMTRETESICSCVLDIHRLFTVAKKVCLNPGPFVCLFVCLSVCLFVCLSVCLFVSMITQKL